MTKDCRWAADGLNKELSPNGQFSVLIQFLWSPPPVQPTLGTLEGLHKDSCTPEQEVACKHQRVHQESTRSGPPGLHQDFFRHPLSVAYLRKNIADGGN